MNKELIKKYKPEFDHWLNGGSTLLGIRNLVSSTIRWYPSISDPFEEESTSGELLVIINDEYSIYRKALAEGKTIQINNSNPETWIDIDTDKLANYNPSFLRIKPDESKFKAGDFVRYIHSTPARALEINNINGNRYYFTNSEMSCVEHELELWTPVKGEWCWFYDSKSSKSSHLAKFKQMSRQFFESEEIGIYDYCEPFLNSLPSYLKDK